MLINEQGVLSCDRHPYLHKYEIKYLCSMCILMYCTPDKQTPILGQQKWLQI